MKKLACLLLCAGKSERAGTFKPLAKWRGEAFLAKVYRSMRDTGQLDQIVVVTGHRAQQLQVILQNLKATSVFNPNYALGVHSSIRTGLNALKPGWEGVCIAMADQPQLDTEDYRLIFNQFSLTTKDLVRPYFGNDFGNPAIIGFNYTAEILAQHDNDRGCAYLFERYPERVEKVEMPNDKCQMDFDTHEAVMASGN